MIGQGSAYKNSIRTLYASYLPFVLILLWVKCYNGENQDYFVIKVLDEMQLKLFTKLFIYSFISRAGP